MTAKPNTAKPLVSHCSNDEREFWTITILFSILWVIVPWLFFWNDRLDVIEQFIVGREWVMATKKHPALTATLLEITSILMFRSSLAPYLLSRLFVLVTLWSIWKMAKEYLTPSLALVAVFAMFNYFYYQFGSTEYNNNITLNAAWALAIFFTWRAFRTQYFRYWVLAGVAIGIGLHFKLTMLLLPFTIVLFLLLDPQGRRYWRTPGPWISILVAMIFFSPLLYWFAMEGREMADYAAHTLTRSASSNILKHIVAPLKTAGILLSLSLPVLLPLLFFYSFKSSDNKEVGQDNSGLHDQSFNKGRQILSTFQGRFLIFILFVPFLLEVLISAWSGGVLRSALGTHLWPFITIVVLFYLQPQPTERQIVRVKQISIGGAAVILLFAVPLVLWGPAIRGKTSRYHFPGRELAAEVERLWHEQHEVPLPWTSGAWWLAGNVAVYGRDQARVHFCGEVDAFRCDVITGTWSTAQDVNQQGGALLWNITPEEDINSFPSELFQYFPDAKVLPSLEIPFHTRYNVPPLRVGIALVAPPAG